MNNGISVVSPNQNSEPFVNRAWYQSKEFAGHFFKYIQNVPNEMNQSLIATITVTALVNIPVFLVTNFLVNHFDSHWDGQKNPTIVKERTTNHIILRELLMGAAVFGCNLGLATLAKVHLNAVTVGLFAAASAISVAIHYIQNRGQTTFPDLKGQENKEISEDKDLKIAELQIKADRTEKLLKENGDLSVRIEALGTEHTRIKGELQEAQKTLQSNKEESAQITKNLKEDLQRVEREKREVEAEKQKVLSQIDQLTKQAREALELKERTEISHKKLETEVEKFTSAAANAQREKGEFEAKLTQECLKTRNLQKELEESARSKIEIQDTLEAVRKDLTKKDEAFRKLQSQMLALDKEKSQITKQHDGISQELDVVRKHSEATNKTNQALSEQISLLQDQLSYANERYAVIEKAFAEKSGIKGNVKIVQDTDEDFRITEVGIDTEKTAPSTPVKLTKKEASDSAKKCEEDFQELNTKRPRAPKRDGKKK